MSDQSNPVHTVLTLAETIHFAHIVAMEEVPAIRAKADMPRKGDIVAVLDETGNVLATGTINRKPANLTLIRWDRTGLVNARNTDNLVKVDKGVWSVS